MHVPPRGSSAISLAFLRLTALTDGPAALKCVLEDASVHVLQGPSRGNPTREAREERASLEPSLQGLHHRVGGRLTLDVRVCSQDDLTDLRGAHPLHQRRDRELFSLSAFSWVQRAHEHVIDALEGSGALDRFDMSRLFHHADERDVTLRIGTDRARVALRDVAT